MFRLLRTLFRIVRLLHSFPHSNEHKSLHEVDKERSQPILINSAASERCLLIIARVFYYCQQVFFSNTTEGSYVATKQSLVGPTKIKAPKSFLFTVGLVKIENKEHLFDFIIVMKYYLLGSQIIVDTD